MVRRPGRLACITVVAFALPMSTATAVDVGNNGMNSADAENMLAIGIHTTAGFIPTFLCDQEWELDINAVGTVTVDDVVFHEHPGSTLTCSDANDCNDDGWPGQVSEGGAAEYMIDLGVCLTNTGHHFDGTAVGLECPINDNEIHCDWEVGTLPPPNPPLMIEFLGEIVLQNNTAIEHEAR